jgi:soluble lytic murein transglycosylase-like protein
LIVNFSLGAVAPKLRMTLVLVAALAALIAGGAAWTAPAVASNGGVSATDDDYSDGGNKYQRIFRRMSDRNKRWARHTARCESGKDPNAIGGGGMYRGAFQFMKQTWRAAPRSPGGDPIDYGYKTQAVVAVKLKKRDGAGHWPNCG